MSNPPCVSDGVRIRVTIATDILGVTRVLTIIINVRRENTKRTSVRKRDVRRVELSLLAAATTTNVTDLFARHADRTGRWGTSVTCGHYKNELPSCDNIMYVFYEFETTQDTRYSETATEHVRNLVCLQQVL
jgi:hypothetical protein